MINNIIIAGSILMFIGIFITTFEYGHLMPEYVENHMCMVSKCAWVSLLPSCPFPNIAGISLYKKYTTFPFIYLVKLRITNLFLMIKKLNEVGAEICAREY